MKLYNTLSRSIEELTPLEKGKIKLYNCGLTVYSQPHIGNWIGYIYWDVLVRTLEAANYDVERTQNITDVGHLTSDDDNGEDKMEKGARREGITAWDVANKYIGIADKEAELLGLKPPDYLVRATAMINEQIEFAQILENKGFLYRINGDGMYFDTSKLPDYGKLARLDIDGLEAGARVSVEGKHNITDFAVWKFSPADTKRDMEWDSPWGLGFPGWHLECSVIARETLGDQIDIHTGGIDHIPVHHTNEIAQTEAVTGKTFSKLWLHVNHIKSDGQKMSKSLGNIYTLDDIQKKGYSLDAFKVFVLQKHYRTEGNFTWDNLDAAQNRLNNWREISALVWQQDVLTETTSDLSQIEFQDRLETALQNDLDTVSALQIIDDVLSVAAQGVVCDACFRGIIEDIDELLGIDISVENISAEQGVIIQDRDAARAVKDWETSDRLRDQLLEQGIGLRDTIDGAIWYYI